MSRPLRICIATAEFTPLAKTGGLADVSAALATYLTAAGHEVLTLLPNYSSIDREALGLEPEPLAQDFPIRQGPHEYRCTVLRGTLPDSDVPIHLLDCPALYGREGVYSEAWDEHLRFAVLSRAAIELCQRLRFQPDVMHCHDWHTALIPLYLRTRYAWDAFFANTKSVLTIHNNGYQGRFGSGVVPELAIDGGEHLLHQDHLAEGYVSYLETGILYADRLTTVSPTHAQEMMTDAYGMGLQALMRERAESFVGILNGVDYREWDPATDTMIPANFSADDLAGKAECKRRLQAELGLEVAPDRPLLGLISRLVSQKGINLIEQALPRLLSDQDFSFAVLGSGESRYERFFEALQHRFRGRVCFYRGYNPRLSHWIEAGSDLYLMPSRYEPCGLNQMYSLRYGTIPIVRATGGLADSVEPLNPRTGTGTGIVFEHYDAPGLTWAVSTGLALYRQPALRRRVMLNGMQRDFSWERQIGRYVDLYRSL